MIKMIILGAVASLTYCLLVTGTLYLVIRTIEWLNFSPAEGVFVIIAFLSIILGAIIGAIINAAD